MTSRRPGWLGPVLLALACSTLAKIPDAEECTVDTDCAEGFLCAVDQGRCLPGDQAAPRAHLGFDIREQAAGNLRYRVEVDGCDCVVDDRDLRELVLRRPAVSQLLELAVTAADDVGEGLMAGDLLPARFVLSQASRYGQEPSPNVGSVNHPTVADDSETPVDTEIFWPRHHPNDRFVRSELILWKIEPEGGLASRYLGLIPPETDDDLPCQVHSDCCAGEDCDPSPNFCDPSVGQCTAVGQPEWIYHYNYQPACSRGILGDVVPVDLPTMTLLGGEGVAVLDGATVTVRHAPPPEGRFGVSVFGEVPPALRPPQCNIDSDCDFPAQYCDQDTRQCFVNLQGLLAGSGSASNVGLFSAEVYTYCDGNIDEQPTRYLDVTVQPPGPRPTVHYVLPADFGAVTGDFDLGKSLCVPNWGGDSVPLEIKFEGNPLMLGDSGYECCDVGCLPATADDVEDSPPVETDFCDGRTSAGAPPTVEIESHFLPDATDWDSLDCHTPTPDIWGRLGTFSTTAVCTSPGGTCLVDEVALGTADTPRRYEVRFESEVGSVVASEDFIVEIGDEPPEVITRALTPRTLVTGVVDVDQETCNRRDNPGDCAAREAVVLAERLRMPDEVEGTIPGPYFHTVPTYYDPAAQRDGAFVLPLDPGGVYVVTALPLAGAEGGPSGWALVDLRQGGAPAPLRLELEEGVVVSLRLDQFDHRTVVIPMDRGSFLAPGRTLAHPARDGTADPFIDLNRPDECWTDDNFDGCRIRRLIPPGSDLSRSQVGIARFTARQAGLAECNNQCIPPDQPSP